MVRYYFAVIIILLLNSCVQPEQLNDTEKDIIISDVKEMFNNYHSDIKKEGLTAEFKYLDQTSNFFWVPPGYNSALDYDSVYSILVNNAKMFSEVIFKWNTLQVFPLTEEIANYSGVVEGSMTDTSGIVNSVLIIESGTVVKRFDGWKLLNGQSAVLEPDTNE
jgi:hypothetical protein